MLASSVTTVKFYSVADGVEQVNETFGEIALCC